MAKSPKITTAKDTANKPKPVIRAIGEKLTVEAGGDNYSSDEIQKLLVGVCGYEAFNMLINQAASGYKGKDNENKLNSLMPLLLDIAPKDSLEGMLAVQMVATHNLAMEMASRTILPDQTVDGVNDNINRSTKLMRAFTKQIETLQKYRNKGQQTIQVQHVTVNDGGQAVVGNVAGGAG